MALSDDAIWRYLHQLPAGFSSGCRPEDWEWCETYRRVDYPNDIANPVDALPAGFDAYTMIMASRQTGSAENNHPHVPWVTNAEPDPWPTLIAQLDAAGIEADIGLSTSDRGALVTELDLDTTALYSCGFFSDPYEICTATGDALKNYLTDPDGYDPTVWFPHDHQWVVCIPFDGPMTYVASNTELAVRLRTNPDLETYECTYSP